MKKIMLAIAFSVGILTGGVSKSHAMCNTTEWYMLSQIYQQNYRCFVGRFDSDWFYCRQMADAAASYDCNNINGY
jgi:hypothetical protein